MTGALWAAASGIGFGLFQSLNRRAIRDIDDAFVSTFLQLLIAAVVLIAACVATGDLDRLAAAPADAVAAFMAAGVVHFLLGWTFLNLSQKRIGAARTAPLLTLSPIFGLVIAALTVGDLPSAAALAAIAPMVAGAWLVAGGRRVRPADAVFGLGCALMWAISPVFTVKGLDGLASPLLGVTLGMVASTAAYGVAMTRRSLGGIARGAMAFKLLAGLLVALATWWRWIALDGASVGVVLALSLLSVPTVLFLAPLVVGRHLERVGPRVWAGSTLVVGGALALIVVG
ncbi:MAG TPA: DMT family transporter [Solirubrobacteraceae bacterium]|nr:DMT family transporter [Solirubrobacteraceae bacterium]